MFDNHSLINDFFKTFINEVEQGLAVINPCTGILEQCNDFFAEALGATKCDLIGKSILKIIPAFNDLAHSDKIFLAKKMFSFKKVPIQNELVGSYILLFLSGEVGADEKNNDFLVTALKTALDHVDEGVLISDSDNKLVYANKTQLQFDGNNYEDILGKYSWDVYGLEKEDSLLYKCLQDGKPSKPYIHYYLSKTGQYIRVTGNNHPIKKEAETIGVVGIARDLKKSEKTVTKMVELQKGNQSNQTELEGYPQSGNRNYSFTDIIGESEAIKESLNRAENVARSDSSVFLCGETGTGKEMFAQSIHYASERKTKPLVSINCAAIPDTLLEGIIFGTVKGIYTGADDRKGLFEEAADGTLFLDEINSLPIHLQGKLLRALEERKIRRLGGKDEISVNVRIISSCNVDPQLAIAQNQLRSDLYYRLAVVSITIPPLRERRSDIIILAEYFIKLYSLKFGKNIEEISPNIKRMLLEGSWPGNCRQLKHWIEYAMNLVPANQNVLTEQYAPHKIDDFKIIKTDENANQLSSPKTGNVFEEIRIEEADILIEILKRNHGNITKSAQEIGISRQGLQYRMRKLGIIK